METISTEPHGAVKIAGWIIWYGCSAGLWIRRADKGGQPALIWIPWRRWAWWWRGVLGAPRQAWAATRGRRFRERLARVLVAVADKLESQGLEGSGTVWR